MRTSHDPESVDEAGYERLAALRGGICTYLAWAEQRAREHDMDARADEDLCQRDRASSELLVGGSE